MNFQPNRQTILNMQEAVFSNIDGMINDLQTRVKREIYQGLAAGESKEQIKKRIANIFRGDTQNRFKFEERIKLIQRTETVRIENLAVLDSAEQLPFKTKKRVAVVVDNRTSAICRAMNKKYGKDNQAIALGRMFTVKVKIGKKTQTISAKTPPFHPNCRTAVQLVVVDEEKKKKKEDD